MWKGAQNTFKSDSLSTYGYKMPSLEQKSFQRQVAYKVKISDILNGNLTKDDASAGFIRMNDLNVSRTNIIATVVYKSDDMSYASALIDDGTGKIPLRSFENKDVFSKIDIGDAVLVIGKIREFNNEKYIIPEILKKINNIEWVNLRKAELEKNKMIGSDLGILKTENNILIEGDNFGIDEEVYSLIKKLDNGDGASFEDVIKSSKNAKAENVITKLLENGDIFEIKPGKLKVLE